jgi:hypothetical protein
LRASREAAAAISQGRSAPGTMTYTIRTAPAGESESSAAAPRLKQNRNVSTRDWRPRLLTNVPAGLEPEKGQAYILSNVCWMGRASFEKEEGTGRGDGQYGRSHPLRLSQIHHYMRLSPFVLFCSSFCSSFMRLSPFVLLSPAPCQTYHEGKMGASYVPDNSPCPLFSNCVLTHASHSGDGRP